MKDPREHEQISLAEHVETRTIGEAIEQVRCSNCHRMVGDDGCPYCDKQ